MWQSVQPRFTQSFFGYCFECNGYGNRNFECKYNIGPRKFSSRNTFAPLMDYAIECYNYHNCGYIAKKLQECHLFQSISMNIFFSHRVWDKIKVSREIGTKKQTGRDNTWNQDRFQQGMEREGITLIVQIALKA